MYVNEVFQIPRLHTDIFMRVCVCTIPAFGSVRFRYADTPYTSAGACYLPRYFPVVRVTLLYHNDSVVPLWIDSLAREALHIYLCLL